MSEQIIISLGSNLGYRLESLHKALALLEEYPISVKQLSRVYETPAWGFESAPFYNACVTIATDLNPNHLLEVFLAVEQRLGRSRLPKPGYTARSIDLDLLFYKNEIVQEADNSFIKSVNTLLEQHPLLKDVFDKKITYTIPKCVRNGTMLRIRGKGFPAYNNPNVLGDFYINIFVDLPESLTDEQEDLIKKIKEIKNG